MVEVEPMRGSPILLILAATMPAATASADFVITSMPPVHTAPPIARTTSTGRIAASARRCAYRNLIRV